MIVIVQVDFARERRGGKKCHQDEEIFVLKILSFIAQDFFRTGGLERAFSLASGEKNISHVSTAETRLDTTNDRGRRFYLSR